MKKLASILFLFLLLLLSSCSILEKDFREVKELLATPVCVSGVIEQETTITFKIYVYETETLFTFNDPETLRPLSVKKNTDGYFAQYDGIATKIDHGSIMAVDALDSAVKTIRMSETCGQQIRDDQNVLLFSIDGLTVLVYYDNEAKQITKIISEANGQSFTYEILSVNTIQT